LKNAKRTVLLLLFVLFDWLFQIIKIFICNCFHFEIYKIMQVYNLVKSLIIVEGTFIFFHFKIFKPDHVASFTLKWLLTLDLWVLVKQSWQYSIIIWLFDLLNFAFLELSEIVRMRIVFIMIFFLNIFKIRISFLIYASIHLSSQNYIINFSMLVQIIGKYLLR
jgi:hypothetical protein